jgi:NAD(P)H-dependent FMN reductase
MSPKLQVIICSTRPGRVGPSVARWFYEFAGSQNTFNTQLIDLADFNLPLLD